MLRLQIKRMDLRLLGSFFNTLWYPRRMLVQLERHLEQHQRRKESVQFSGKERREKEKAGIIIIISTTLLLRSLAAYLLASLDFWTQALRTASERRRKRDSSLPRKVSHSERKCKGTKSIESELAMIIAMDFRGTF